MTTPSSRWVPPALLEPPDATSPPLLATILSIVDEQRVLLEADIDRLWDDLFVESCADWAVPYIGALLGLPPDAERTEVAFAVALRRRKGTPAALEDFAFVLTGNTARVSEGWQITGWAQRLGHPGPPQPTFLDLRDPAGLARVGTPFERARRSVSAEHGWAPAAVTAVVWPWSVRTLVRTEAAPLPEERRFALHPLGVAAPLYLRPREPRLATEGTAAGTRTGDEADAPVRATYRVLQALARPGEIGYGNSLTVAPTHPLASEPGEDPTLIEVRVGSSGIPWEKLRFGSLQPGSPALAPPGADEVVVDTQRGFLELGASLSGTVRTSWHRAVPGTIGALASTSDIDPAARVVVSVNPSGAPGTVPDLAQAFQRAEQLSAGLSIEDSRPGVADVEIRLLTGDRLPAPPVQSFAPTLPNWRIVAPPLTTPVITGELSLDLEGAHLSIAGFFLNGNLVLGPNLSTVDLIGLTMNPPSAELRVDATAWELALSARQCVLGPIRADLGALPITLTDCIVDGRRRLHTPGQPAGGGAEVAAVTARNRFGPDLRADSVTFSGPVLVDALDATDCLFADGVDVAAPHTGCLRHCHLGPDLSTPPRRPPAYRCGPFPAPVFVSDAFDSAGYYCLELEPEHPLLSAASDGGEIGAYRRTRRAARIRRLRQRIDEFVPLGLSSDVAVAPWEER